MEAGASRYSTRSRIQSGGNEQSIHCYHAATVLCRINWRSHEGETHNFKEIQVLTGRPTPVICP
jgi:hypothetical protein